MPRGVALCPLSGRPSAASARPQQLTVRTDEDKAPGTGARCRPWCPRENAPPRRPAPEPPQPFARGPVISLSAARPLGRADRSRYEIRCWRARRRLRPSDQQEHRHGRQRTSTGARIWRMPGLLPSPRCRPGVSRRGLMSRPSALGRLPLQQRFTAAAPALPAGAGAGRPPTPGHEGLSRLVHILYSVPKDLSSTSQGRRQNDQALACWSSSGWRSAAPGPGRRDRGLYRRGRARRDADRPREPRARARGPARACDR